MCLSGLQVLGELRQSRQTPCASARKPGGRPVCGARGPGAFHRGSSVDLTSAHTRFFPLLHPRSNQVGRQDPSLSGRHVAAVTLHLNGLLGNLSPKFPDAWKFTSREPKGTIMG